MRWLRKNYDVAIFLLVVGGFVCIAGQRLGTAPMPDEGDEAMTLQVPYEMIHRGNSGFPMYRYLGGNIENDWHSFRPVYNVMSTAFFKLFGWGLLQGRALDLIMAVLVLMLAYAIGRKLFDWRAAFVACLMLVSDPTFMERGRMVRYDYAAAMFALLAFLLYELAREKKRGAFYIASGLAAGAGAMCHPNSVYMLGGIVLLILLSDGLKSFIGKKLYQFLAGAFAVMSYEIIYNLIDYKNTLLHYHGDKAHFSLFSFTGLWENLSVEPVRYEAWFSGQLFFSKTPLALLHLFQLLSFIAFIYLIVVCAMRIKRKNAVSEPRVRLLIITVGAMLLLALTTGYKRKYVPYIVHLTPWFALGVGILLRDTWEFIKHFKMERVQRAEFLHKVAMAGLASAIVIYGALLIRQYERYLSQVNNPDSPTFEEFATALKSIVPEGVCPTSFLHPVIWLVFPEADRCYSTIEGRMMDAVDIAGKDYALIVPRRKSAPWMRNPEATYHLIGAMDNTPYGDMRIYYTGVDPKYLSLASRHYQFFHQSRGYVSDEQLNAAREVWSADAAKLSESSKAGSSSIGAEGLLVKPHPSALNGVVELCQIELKPGTIYRLSADAVCPQGNWELVIGDDQTGVWVEQIVLKDEPGTQRVVILFRTLAGSRVNVLLNPNGNQSAGPLYVSRVVIDEVAQIR